MIFIIVRRWSVNQLYFMIPACTAPHCAHESPCVLTFRSWVALNSGPYIHWGGGSLAATLKPSVAEDQGLALLGGETQVLHVTSAGRSLEIECAGGRVVLGQMAWVI